jgi:hypothetical protein
MEHCTCAMRDFISCSFSSSSRTFSLRVTPCNSGLSLVGPALPFQPRLQGGPDLIYSAAVAIAKMMMSSLESDGLDATLSSPLTHAVVFRIICRSVSELFVVKSLHARAERNVGSSSKCCDGSVSDDPAISGTKEISGDGRGRRGRLLSNRTKMGKSVSEAWAGSSCTQVKRRPRRAKGSLTEDQGRD